MCHCLECQRRSGAPFAVQARFAAEDVRVEGRFNVFERRGDDGGVVRFQFCPECGSTVLYSQTDVPELIAIAVGAFADPSFPAPTVSVYEARQHAWVTTPDDATHYD